MNNPLSTLDLKLACPACSVQSNEITYTLNVVDHQCAHNLLFARGRGTHYWRPISRRPAFPSPIKYEVCWHFVEGKGCTQHKNRCTFARSEEEATVWTFEKFQGLDHSSFCKLVAQDEGITAKQIDAHPGQFESLDDLLETIALKAACHRCSVEEQEITYSIQRVNHMCSKHLLLAKFKDSNHWRPVSSCPSIRNCGSGVVYQVCKFFKEGSGCTKDRDKCTFARSKEEAAVWNFAKDKNIDRDTLLQQVAFHESNSLQPERFADDIFKEFSGKFLELCKDCFLSSPQKVTATKLGDCCSAGAAHPWNPILVHHASESHGKEVYSEVRPLPAQCKFEYCRHVSEGKPCWHETTQCLSAHSEVEMAVWKAENGGRPVRPQLVRLSEERQDDCREAAFYCKACFLTLSSEESFMQHCSSQEHAQMISGDITTQWDARPPPHNSREEFCLCERPDTCEYGDNCLKAHSKEELREWQMRAQEEKEIRSNVDAQGLMPYAERLLEEFKTSKIEAHVISEQVDDVSVTCDEELFVECANSDASLRWNFHVNTERQLVHVALMKHEPGALFSLHELTSESCAYSTGEDFQDQNKQSNDVTVFFQSLIPGLYEQWLVLDFGMRPVLLRKLKVRVGKLSPAFVDDPAENCGMSFQSLERWHRGNRIIVPCTDRNDEQEKLLNKYKPPSAGFPHKHIDYDRKTSLTPENYKEKMHSFLYSEEQAEEKLLSRLSVCAEITTSTTLRMNQGELFCTFSFPCEITPEGFMLRRSLHSCLITPSSPGDQSSKVYEAVIIKETTNKNKMHLKLSKRCCSELGLKNNETHLMEVQFQLDRLSFCMMHKAVDLLPDTKRVLPDLHNCEVPVNRTQCHKLNDKQQSAVDFITGESDSSKDVAPLLIYGPFGTGKTFTLATAARELTKKRQNKVLICTHTNSSADLYVKDHFHSFISQKDHWIRPIRIKTNKHGTALQATDEITLKYCLLSKTGYYFLPPTKAALDGHNIVITTTTMARRFHELQLPKGYFTHILIDEASQMLECEALIPLGLAGPNTRVVLAGDHMQMGPKLFSVEDHQRSDHTLLNRMFHYYQNQKSFAAEKSKIIFNQNYRSTKEIVDFASTHFYVGKSDIVKADEKVPSGPNDHSLMFHHVRGDCQLDTVSMSWFNHAEVTEVVEVVQDILKKWPDSWGRQDQSSVCVLSEGWQVRKIRTALWKKHLDNVNVENFANVQGKEFRVVIITAVQTRESLNSAHMPGLELFNDARVLNTAITRAKSLVVVVGDATALCHFGKCSRVWKAYVDHCISKESVQPNHLTKVFLEREVKEILRFQRPEQPNESFVDTDTILQEMIEEYDQCETKYTSLEDTPEFRPHDDEKLSHSEPVTHKRGQLVIESLSRGYVIPFDDPTKRLHLKGKSSLGKAFNGDEVLVETSFSDNISQNKVVKITDSEHVFVCTLEEHPSRSKPRHPSQNNFQRWLMIPIAKNNPKICILVPRKSGNVIPVWEWIGGYLKIVRGYNVNENPTDNVVFMVEVICWKEDYTFPLGKVVGFFPVGSSLDEGLRILKMEFNVLPTASNSNWMINEEVSNKKEIERTDLRGIFTFTVDPKTAEDLDDAISVKDIGDKYEVGVHIADVASFVRLGDSLDEMAKENGATYYNKGGEPTHMFPHKLSTKDWSLLPGLDRKVVSLMMTVEKETNNIVGKPNFQLSLINSNRKLSYKQAEDIICQKIKEISKFDTVEDSVAVAYRFAKDQRKARLTNWAYCQTDKEREPGKRKAHLMIEELNVLFNKFSAQTLIGKQDTKNCTPLRCQDRPDPKKVEELKEEYGELLPLSFELRHIVDYDQKTANSKSPECFCILSKVWKDIQEAAKEGTDTDKIVDLIAADDIHPHLMPVLSQYKKSLSKAFLIRSNSSDRATIGHYSMELKCYTQASSPIRRYMDVVLQRLLHTVICGTPVQYSAKDIDILCEQFEQVMRTTKEYEQKSEILAFATSMKKHNVSKLAVIVCVDQDRDNFRVSFPFDHDAFPDSVPIMYRDLQLEDQPVHDKKSNSATLKWRRRIYSISSTEIQVKMRQNNSSCTQLPHATWKAIVDAIVDENWTELKSLIMGARTKQLENVKNPGEHGKEAGQHYIDLDLQVKPGDTLQVQMTSEIKRGYLMPTVQLVCLNKNFEVCVDHAHSPIICFSKSANCPTRAVYEDTDEYVEIWKPLCDMESATTAVDDSDSIIIEDLLVNFHGEQRHGARDKSYLKGSFNLPLTFIKEWAIKCNLAKCLLCIRKRGLELTKSEYSKEVDPSTFTWVAHGVTVKSEEVKTPSGKAHKVDFYVKHLPMKTRPNCVFQKNTTFTVEIIPKLLPDIRKENAVINIASACNLVQGLALGKDIPREVVQNMVQRWELIKKKAPEGLPTLNETQFDAVERALKHNFTVIQGPPGTGKTVVGVYIVFWFCKLNTKMSRMFTNPKDKNKKEVILYCGPSNKSVDVVAEYLLKFGDTLKPLRVYSQQVEMLDYPCPDGSLQSSHSSRRQEHSKKELRSITLHHRMREKHNPSSAAIKEFDQKIETQQLTDGEVDEYQLLLRKARKYELERHDIVLCTCTASSSPTLTSTVSARQILIDECAMATEPQALIPLVCNNPEKIVLLGDHKQLRPIVNNYHVRKLGMSLSLFERYFNRNKARAVRLDIQYRMHEDICKFPSDEYYESSLKTRVECPNSVLLVSKKAKHIVFGHIEGQEISLVVSTEKGNGNSKANAAEKDIVVNIAENLVKKAKVAQQDIVILSPYNAQVSNIKAQLRRLKMSDITVTTITRSQGSEWRYVLISTVRSLPSNEIEKEPDRAWLSKNIGFVGDANQINVGISRAKEGLCIIGNQKLLSISWAWKKLLAHYMATGSVTTAEDISVRQVQR